MPEIYNPDEWLVSLHRSLEDYLRTGLNTDLYEIRFDWPASNELPQDAELKKTTIHFIIEEIQNHRLGFGDNVVAEVITDHGVITDPTYYQTTELHEASRHEIQYDVGVWASDQSGGVTARLRAVQTLSSLLFGESARQSCLSATGGVEIMQFNGGRFITDTLSDVRVFRVTDGALRVKVFSRKKLADSGVIVSEIVQQPELTISPEGAL